MKAKSGKDTTAQNEHYAHGYDTLMTKKYHANRTAQTHAAWFLPHLQAGMNLLDCGCGSGSITLGLATAIAPGKATGVDIAEIEIKRAKQNAKDKGIYNVHFETANIYQLAFPSQTFDAVFAHNVLEHIGEPLTALNEMSRVLKPGGVIGIRDADMGGLLLTPISGLLQQWVIFHESVWKAAGGHPRLGRQLRGLFNEAGFTVMQVSASYDIYGDFEACRFIAEIASARCMESDFIEQVSKLELAGRDELEAMRMAWLAWPEDSGAFCALAHGEVIGRKA